MRLMLAVFAIVVFIIWDVSMNRSQFIGPVASFFKRVFT
jgi:hypothetical protein